MTSTSNPPAGTIGLTQIGGRVGKGIEFGQWLNGEGFEIWEHAFVLLPGNLILEAEPGGALIRPLHYSEVYWCNNIYATSVCVRGASPILLAQEAEKLKGIPYSFLDYAALASHRLHIPGPGLKHFIETSHHEICSQLADDFYWRLGSKIFDDNRWPGYVTPASLFKRDLELQPKR